LSLTPEQAAAVLCEAHALEVRAGAGTGKTHTLAHRVAHLAPGLAQQSRCLVVTFTREATASLQRRLSLLLGRDHAVRVLSFHQWAARELPPELRRFMPEAEARRAVAETLLRARPGPGFSRALGVALGEDASARVLGVLSYAKNAQTTLGAALDGPLSNLAPYREALERAQEAYEARKGDRLDYDDLLVAFRDRLARGAAFRQEVVARLDHVFVDEYQDVNGLQADAVRLVSAGPRGARVTVVGDARQSIYGFRGGSPRHLESFLKPYGKRGARLALTLSFRSDRRIVAAANRALPSRYPLRPRQGAPRGLAPEALACADPRDEARTLADRVEALLAEGADPREIVVLSRARHLALAYQEEVVARRADEAWAEDHPGDITDAIDGFLRAARRERVGLAAFAARAEGALGRAARVLARRARAAPPLPARPTAARVLALPKGEDIFHVKVATIHAAKGLEWDHVLLCGAREGGLPSDHALQAPEHVRDALVEEERRLLYVAITRARKSFLATWPRVGERRAHEPCRWLASLAASGSFASLILQGSMKEPSGIHP
jgi:DNA helicase-2/ATP-dependent DNA helicase PcrA